MPYKKETAYNNLPILPPHAELETVQILKKTVSAHKALAELHGWTYMQANPLLLLQTVSLQEAKSSSEIENVVTTNDDYIKHFRHRTVKSFPHLQKKSFIIKTPFGMDSMKSSNVH